MRHCCKVPCFDFNQCPGLFRDVGQDLGVVAHTVIPARREAEDQSCGGRMASPIWSRKLKEGERRVGEKRKNKTGKEEMGETKR